MSKKKYDLVMQYSLYGYCLSAGLSIAASQIFVCTNILTYLCFYFFKDTNYKDLQISKIKRSGLLFLTASLICSIVGINFSHSWIEILKTSLYFIFPFAILKTIENCPSSKIKSLWLLLISQSIASIHTLITTSFPSINLPNTPGAVTESGQLVLIIPIAFALFYQVKEYKNIVLFSLTFLSFIASCYFNPLISVIILLILIYKFTLYYKTNNAKIFLPFILSLLLAALAVNLKRGPWMGVFFEFLLIGIFISKRFIYYSLISSTLLLTIEPIRQRISSLGDHFLIQGGRYAMWKLGLDIFARYPLGIGLNNSSYMRVFDPSLPPTHRHMHNNLLNIAVESGIIGLVAYIALFYAIYIFVVQLYKKADESSKIIIFCLGIAIFAWQIAGTVEYNFGDSEIRLIALLILGVLLSYEKETTSPVSTL